MLRRLACCAVFALALAFVPAALADGLPLYAALGGPGVLSPDGKVRWVTVGDGQHTVLEAVQVADGTVRGWLTLYGGWGIPTIAYGSPGGLSRDGRTLILGSTSYGPISAFAVVDTKQFRVRDTLQLKGSFAFDALSPDATRLYLVQHVSQQDTSRYVVRALDLDTDRLLPGRIADRTQKSWVMKGYAVSRATSGDGRWVYTLYQNPGGYPFVHALDTTRGVAHCVGIPWTGSEYAPSNMQLALRNGGDTLAIHWRSGREYLRMDTRTWRLSPAGGGFPWWWIPVAAVAAAALLFVTRGILRRARRSAPALAGGGSGPIPALHDARPESG